jgi:hypothetical protein
MIVSNSPRTATTDPRKSWGYSICMSQGVWIGKEWERVTCLQVDSTPLTDAMTEAEARAWLAAMDA